MPDGFCFALIFWTRVQTGWPRELQTYSALGTDGLKKLLGYALTVRKDPELAGFNQPGVYIK